MHCLGGFIPPPAHSPALALEGRGRKHAPVTAIQQVPGDLVPQAILRACPQRILTISHPPAPQEALRPVGTHGSCSNPA